MGDIINFEVITCLEHIMKGDRLVIWGLLNQLREIYPDICPKQTKEFLERIDLPYSLEELRDLEISILGWLSQIGMFTKL